MAFIHMDLTTYTYTACINLTASSLDGRSHMLCACCSFIFASFVGLHDCHCLWYWDNGIWYLSCSYPLPMRMGFIWHVISTYYSLYTVTSYLVKMDTLPSSAVFPTLISDVGNYSNVSDSAALLESCGNVSVVTYLPLQVPPLDTPTFVSDIINIGRPNLFLSF